ncbi:nucleoside deaminase [Microbacterium lacus]|uniref:nucleoside deaminase n=1 Tax=Microbacterium lacus TaxID=415217 RepID=UPI000C2CA914|nr:nucleoside deaminase [Microbacterium lacus]|tara:strand:+ start:1860 stop:2348 length:489 start_codon:yes stop_codon:yes gene_type:complete
MPASLSDEDLGHLRESIRVAEQSRAEGSHPFGSLVVDVRGRIVSSYGNNSLPPHGDPTQHAEMRAVAAAARLLGPDGMRGSTLFTSAEPCAMCAGAAYWTGIDRVVYALSERRLLSLTGAHEENPTLDLPCREVFARGQRTVQVVGPMLEDEAAQAHTGFWV